MIDKIMVARKCSHSSITGRKRKGSDVSDDVDGMFSDTNSVSTFKSRKSIPGQLNRFMPDALNRHVTFGEMNE